MAVTSIVLADATQGLSSVLLPRAGISVTSLEVEPAVRVVTEDRVGGHGAVDTTQFLSAATVSLIALLYGDGTTPGGTGQAALLDEINAMLGPDKRPVLVVTDSDWPQAEGRQLTVRLDSMQKIRTDPTNWPVQINWVAPNGIWEDAATTELDVPVTLPSTTGLIITSTSTSLSFTATNASPCVFTATGSAYTAGQEVTITGSAPTGFTSGLTYFVVNPSGTSFSLATTSTGTAVNSTSTGSGNVQTVAGLHISGHNGLDMPPTSAPGEFTTTNPGTVASQWTATLYGPATGPKLANDTTGLTLEFTDDVTLQAGDFVALDSAARSALLNGDPGSSVLSDLDFSRSDWFQLQPGVNQLRYFPSSGSAGAEAIVVYRPAWMA